VLRAEAEFLADRRARRGKIERPSVDLRRAAVGPLGAEEDLGGLRAARAEQAGNADHLAGAHVEVEGLDMALAAEIAETIAHRAALPLVPRLGRHLLHELAPEHHGDQVAARQVGRLARADELAVAQHGDAVADLVDLFEEMGDEDDAEAALLEAAHDAEE